MTEITISDIIAAAGKEIKLLGEIAKENEQDANYYHHLYNELKTNLDKLMQELEKDSETPFFVFKASESSAFRVCYCKISLDRPKSLRPVSWDIISLPGYYEFHQDAQTEADRLNRESCFEGYIKN